MQPIFFLSISLLAQTSSQDWLKLGNDQFYKHDFAQAKTSFEHAIQIDPQSADAYRSLGMAELELRQYDTAYRAWLKTVELNPKDEQVRQRLIDAIRARDAAR